jgi:D-serine deaminase-like pyridoxal phosphate-dependent protein
MASGALGLEKVPKPFYPQGIKLIDTELVGEVQTPIRSESKLSIGDIIFLRHAKAGELCEHFNQIQIYDEDGNYLKSFNTYRGDGQCFM